MHNFIDLFSVIFPLIFNGNLGLVNIALNKTFCMESAYPGYEGKEYRAVDGNRSQKIEHCTHTNPENKNSTYVYVDIGYIANIYSVSIYYREEYEHRLDGYALYYSQELFNESDLQQWNLCYRDNPFSNNPNGIISQVCTITARYVLVYQNNSADSNENPILEICEIEIFGCNSGQFIKEGECMPCPGTFCKVCATDGSCLECTNRTYGYQCEENCSASCVGGCNISTGQCHECNIQTYGYRCERNCSESCVGGCNISTGQCYGCHARQFSKGKECIPCPGTFCADCDTEGICLECTNKTYGYQCEENCSESCVGGCNISTGHCYGCHPRQFSKGKECIPCPGTFCADCDTKGICLECTHQTYGYQCEKNCSESCVGGCNISTGQCNACSPDKFGIFCNETCGQCREEPNNDSCDDVTGTCVNGCEKGFTGRLCDEECNGTSFGNNCSETCSETCKWTTNGTRLCNSSIGHCYSCVAGKRGIYCKDECYAMTYGENCSRRCGHCLNGSGCNSVSGECAEGCEAGYQGNNCNETCENKTFGSNCGQICGHCRNDTACDLFSGSCDSGCEPGYHGLTCNKTCGLCLQNTDCDQFNGTCLNGCQEGYQGEICNETCDIGYYGEDCNQTCNENCAESTPMSACQHVTGECLIGCQNGWIGKYCETACSNGTFGQNCAWKCNEWCSGESQSCDPRDGSCLNGCIPGYGGSHCNMYCDEGSYGHKCTNLCGKCFLKDCHHVTGHCAHSEPLCEDGYRGEKCETECGPCTFGPDCRYNCSDWCYEGVCTLESKDSKNDTSTENNKELFKDFLPIFGGGVSAFFLILTIIMAYGLGRWCTGQKIRKRSSQCDTFGMEMSDDTFNTLDLLDSKAFHAAEIPVKRFQRFIAEKAEDDCSIFRAEYLHIKEGKQFDKQTMADKDQNKRFSRFSRFSRNSMMSVSGDNYKVLLPSDISNNEILNAHFVKNIEGKMAYIAAEVSHSTAAWEMIWTKNVSKIVTFSKGQGCKGEWTPYWPEVGETQTFLNYTVATKERRDYAFYSLYFLALQKEHMKREIILFHYNSWPEDDSIIPVDFINFYFRVFHFPVPSSNINGPVLVQCRDGLGRTGVYIALDALYNRGLSHKKINVLQFVQRMRRCRQNMIQSFTQYVILHHLLAEAFVSTYNPLPRKYYMLENEENDAVSHMFSALETNKPTYMLNDYSKAFRNMDFVSNINVLPLDRFYFSFEDEMESDKLLFTNCITVPSYLTRDRFIISQLPLTFSMDNTVAVISRMSSRVIILIGSREETTELTQRLLEGISTHTGRQKDLKKTSISETLCQTELQIQNKEKSIDHSLSICEMSSWPIKYPNNGAYTDMLKVMKIIVETDPTKPIVLLSGDGASGCDVLCTVHNCLEQVFMDDEVDVPARIHQLQTRRPEFISTKEDFKISLDVFRKCLCSIQKESIRVFSDKMKKDPLN